MSDLSTEGEKGTDRITNPDLIAPSLERQPPPPGVPFGGLKYEYPTVIGRSDRILAVLRTVDRATDRDVPVLLQGESGTGKELFARCLHENGPRRRRPFVAINCSAIPESLLESEIFGHVRGAFTGAHADRPGLFTHAEGGTVFLDEIGEMTPIMQVKFLRVLQEREVCPVGGRAPHPIDIRLICATNRDLAQQVREGHFREDLYYRVNVIRIDLPPLRQRAADIPELFRHFLRASGKTLSPRAEERLLRYPWPGNVRELANVLARAEVLAPGSVIQPEDLDLPGHPIQLPCPLEPLEHFLDRAERTYLLEVLRSSRWSRRKSAAILGIDRSTLYRLMKKYRLEPEFTGSPSGLDLPSGLSPLEAPGSEDADPRFHGRMAAS